MSLIRWLVDVYCQGFIEGRWPVHVFFNILDLAGINAWDLFKGVTRSTITRRNFLLKLASELSDRYVTARSQGVSDDDEEYMEPVMKHRKFRFHIAREIKPKLLV